MRSHSTRRRPRRYRQSPEPRRHHHHTIRDEEEGPSSIRTSLAARLQPLTTAWSAVATRVHRSSKSSSGRPTADKAVSVVFRCRSLVADPGLLRVARSRRSRSPGGCSRSSAPLTRTRPYVGSVGLDAHRQHALAVRDALGRALDCRQPARDPVRTKPATLAERSTRHQGVIRTDSGPVMTRFGVLHPLPTCLGTPRMARRRGRRHTHADLSAARRLSIPRSTHHLPVRRFRSALIEPPPKFGAAQVGARSARGQPTIASFPARADRLRDSPPTTQPPPATSLSSRLPEGATPVCSGMRSVPALGAAASGSRRRKPLDQADTSEIGRLASP